MMVCRGRHVICLTLTFPAFIYLFLMFAAIGQICFKTDSGETNFKQDSWKLLDFFQQRPEFRTLQSNQLNNNGKGRLENSIYKRRSSSLNTVLPPVGPEPVGSAVSNQPRPPLTHNCSSISVMKIRNKVGHGVSKQAFIADYLGTQVAIKMVTRHIHEVRNCLDELKRSKTTLTDSSDNTQAETANKVPYFENMKANRQDTSSQQMFSNPDLPAPKPFTKLAVISSRERQRCYTFPTARLMKEILMSEQLQHHNLARLLGYCVRSEESETTDISEHGVISVYELGSRFVLDNLQILPWQTRLRHAIEMADLLGYLENSPLGSLVVPDFKEGHLVMINGSLKLIDLDDVNNLEPECNVRDSGDNMCPYNIRCERAMCEGFNAKENLKNMNTLVFKRLLFPLTFPQSVMADIGQLNAQLDSLSLTSRHLKSKLVEIKTFLMKEYTVQYY